MKLEIQKIKLRNFLSFGAQWQEINFLPGINVVLGFNESTKGSNGSGKSSVLESIIFALFGQVHRDIKKDQIINWRNKKKCEVQLTFIKNDIEYKVHRGIKPDIFNIYKDGELISKPSHMKFYQKTLEEIVGTNHQTFMSLIHSNVNSSKPILSMTTPEKRKFMEKIFGLELYTKINEKANNKIKVIKDKIFENNQTVSINKNLIDDCNSRLVELKSSLKTYQNSQIQLNEARDELKDKNYNIEELNENISKEKSINNTLNSEYEYYRRIKNNINNIIKLLNVKISNNRSNINRIDSKKSIIDEINKKKLELTKMESENTIEMLYTLIKCNDESIKENTKIVDSIKQKIDEINDKLLLIKSDIERKKSKLKLLEKNPNCPTCGQDLTNSTTDVVGTIQSEIDVLFVDNTNISQQKEVLLKEKGVIEDTISHVLKCSSNNTLKINKMEQLNKDINNPLVKNFKDEKDSFIKNIERYNNVLDKLEKLKSKIDIEMIRIDNNISIREENIISLQTDFAEIKELEDSIYRLKERVNREKESRSKIEQLIDKDRVKVSLLNEENMLLLNKLNRFNSMIDYLEHIKILCKDENVKQYAISTIMPYLNKRVNYYLSEVGYPFYVKMDKWLDIDIVGPGITKGSYGSLSGGEGRGIDLSLQFAFLDIARIQAGSWPDILVFDELLDSSVDNLSIGKLIEIIKTKQQEDVNSKIFIISHRSEIGGELETDQKYIITKKDGYSKIEVK